MKKSALFIIIILLIGGCQQTGGLKKEPPPSVAVTMELSGIIASDREVGGIVNVSSNVYVPKGVTLTFLPGTTVIVTKSESTKVLPYFMSQNTEILIKGGIIAKGDKERKITFTSDQQVKGMKDYAGIILYQSEKAVFENCVFKNAQTAISAIKSELTLVSVEFEDCFYALSADGSKVRVDKSIVKNCDKGFYFHRNSSGAIIDSEFSGCFEDAVFIAKTSSIDISGSLFKNNLWGISTIEYAGKYKDNNEFINNGVDIRGLNY